MARKLKLGISACMMGHEVRYDGKHKRSEYCLDVLAKQFDLVSLCPEVAAGLSVPRPPIQLVMTEFLGVQAKGVCDRSLNPSAALREVLARQSVQLAELSGYVLMHRSPSCGVRAVPVYSEAGVMLHEQGVGLFAQGLRDAFPLLPLIEASDLDDEGLLDQFLVAVMEYRCDRD